ncbi:DnaD domain-containing protein [Oceanobacillus senegalensis]|uniref:DnaD domain-containing protein n=1 Tax=Oceanobacillus senegalensis TaxID=1936063 RepID=UPI000A307CD3|nr:DnaD domain protein [Oceanobacillus senegalensis]
MNYIKEVNAFYDRMETDPLSSSATSLWFALMHIYNKTRWCPSFTVAGTVLRMKSGLKVTSFKRARTELKEKGYIDYQSRSRGQAPIYQMKSLVLDRDQRVNAEADQHKDQDQDTGQENNQHADQGTDQDTGDTTGQEKDQHKDPLFKQKVGKKKDNLTSTLYTSEAFLFYQENFGKISPYISNSLQEWLNEMDEDLVIEAMKRTLERNKTSWNYVKSILQSWKDKGILTLTAAKEEDRAFRNKKKASQGYSASYSSKDIVPDWFKERQRKNRLEAQRKEMERKDNTPNKGMSVKQAMKLYGLSED